jgi:Glycosyltransferase
MYLSKAKYIFGRTVFDKNCTLALNPHRKYFVVNEVMRNEFYSKHWKGSFSSNDTLRFVSVISGMLYKGLETIIKTSYILKTYSHIDFQWDIVGVSTSDKFVKMSEMEAGKLSSDYNVNYLGKINAEHLSELLCLHDVYIHPSHIENSPNSVCEAMLVGLPVIATNVGGTSSMIENGKEGTLVQDGDPYVLAGAIVDLLNNPKRAYEYANNARQTAVVRHNQESIINELLHGYHEILKDYGK